MVAAMSGLFTLWVALWGANFSETVLSSRNVQSDENNRGLKTACEYAKGGNSAGLSLDMVGTVSTGESANTGEATTWCMGEMTSMRYDNVDVGGASCFEQKKCHVIHNTVGTGNVANTGESENTACEYAKGGNSAGLSLGMVGAGDAVSTCGSANTGEATTCLRPPTQR